MGEIKLFSAWIGWASWALPVTISYDQVRTFWADGRLQARIHCVTLQVGPAFVQIAPKFEVRHA